MMRIALLLIPYSVNARADFFVVTLGSTTQKAVISLPKLNNFKIARCLYPHSTPLFHTRQYICTIMEE